MLAAHGVEVDESPSRFGTYAPARKSIRLAWGAAALIERSNAALQSRKYDLTFLQREMIATMVTAERLTRSPRVLDVDDAIWLSGGEGFARRLAGLADRIICGNAFLADKFNAWNRQVTILPTAVDTARFLPDYSRRQPGLIGWSGSSSGLRYLQAIQKPLTAVLEKHKHARLRVVSDRPAPLDGIPPERVEFLRWTPETEVATIQEMAVGLMPLQDSDWERGKCSYKMLLYAACGVPSIITPVGMNAEVLAKANVGTGARTDSEWLDALDHALSSPDEAARQGARGRELVKKEFSMEFIGPQLANELRNAAHTSYGR